MKNQFHQQKRKKMKNQNKNLETFFKAQICTIVKLFHPKHTRVAAIRHVLVSLVIQLVRTDLIEIVVNGFTLY